MKTSKVLIFFNIFLRLLCSSHALDTLKPGMTLHSDETLISTGGVFELGFFTPKKSTSEYLGIWFKNDRSKKPVWVAHREIRLINSTGYLTIWYDGNLVISDITTVQNIVNTGAVAKSNETSAKILDTGNLILMERGNIIWQSFDYPTDTLLPGMSLGWFNKNITNCLRMQYLTSWLSPSDPNKGDYSLGIDTSNMTKFNVWRKDTYQQIGFWDGHVFRFFYQTSLANQYNFSFVSNGKDTYLTFNKAESNTLTWFVLASDGLIKEFKMVGKEISSVNHSLCDATLPRNSTGCLVLTPMMCKDENNFSHIRGFLPNSGVVSWPATSSPDCELICRSNCSCAGYVFLVDTGTGCKLYYGNKDDLLKNIGRGHETIYVRGDASKSGKLFYSSIERKTTNYDVLQNHKNSQFMAFK